MLLPIMGLILGCIVLIPFAAFYLAWVPEARNPLSLFRFYLGSLLWPHAFSGLAFFLEVRHIWLPPSLFYLLFLAPAFGALVDWVSRQFVRSQARPSVFIPALSLALLLPLGTLYSFHYLSGIDYHPDFTADELLGSWSGRDGELVLTKGSFTRGQLPPSLTVNGDTYYFARSAGQLCLTSSSDPDGAAIRYRKRPPQ